MKRILCFVSILVLLFAFSSCGNQNVFDANYTMEYIVIRENDACVLHKVESWSDSESDSVTVTTSCCGNYIWTSTNNATLYKSRPADTAFDRACGETDS
ncbi:MAG: hypothetical protein IJX39_02805 [Clostridia bacterium]|nr:hypothetical protein [Clostridia bacterium]